MVAFFNFFETCTTFLQVFSCTFSPANFCLRFTSNWWFCGRSWLFLSVFYCCSFLLFWKFSPTRFRLSFCALQHFFTKRLLLPEKHVNFSLSQSFQLFYQHFRNLYHFPESFLLHVFLPVFLWKKLSFSVRFLLHQKLFTASVPLPFLQVFPYGLPQTFSSFSPKVSSAVFWNFLLPTTNPFVQKGYFFHENT